MGRRRILCSISLGVLALSIAALVVGPASAQEGCTFTQIVNRSRDGLQDGMVTGTLYQSGDVWIFRGSKRLKVEFRNGTDVLYHQVVKAIPSKTSLRVFMEGQLDIDVVARRAGAEPRELSYQYDCVA